MGGLIAPAQASPTSFDELPTLSKAEHKQELLNEVQEKIAAAGGGEILGEYSTDYTPANASESGIVAMDLPNGCSIHGVVYFTYRSSSQSSVYNEGDTYCPGATNIEMSLQIVKHDLSIFGGEIIVGSDFVTGNGPQIQGEAEYRCPTGNLSGFWGSANGVLTLDGTAWVAGERTAEQRFDCG